MEAITNLSVNKKLHGLYLTGHGDLKNVTITNEDGTTEIIQKSYFKTYEQNDQSSGPAWDIEYSSSQVYDPLQQSTWGINQALNYKLGAFIAHSCHSAHGEARSLCSANGLFWGSNGVAYSSDVIIAASLWGWKQEDQNLYTFGGWQKTAVIHNLSLYGNYVFY